MDYSLVGQGYVLLIPESRRLSHAGSCAGRLACTCYMRMSLCLRRWGADWDHANVAPGGCFLAHF